MPTTEFLDPVIYAGNAPEAGTKKAALYNATLNFIAQLVSFIYAENVNQTIKENIKFGRPNATDEEVYEACRMAHVDHFIRTLDKGYNTIVSEETASLSQGQKQLITIARAFLTDPKILILDEATSSVDTRTEHLIQDSMEKLRKGRTAFTIAHRLSTIKNADIIIVLDKGDVVEVGDHNQLMEKNGFYAKLYNSQFEG